MLMLLFLSVQGLLKHLVRLLQIGVGFGQVLVCGLVVVKGVLRVEPFHAERVLASRCLKLGGLR